MKLITTPIFECTDEEYKNYIQPTIDALNKMDTCPRFNNVNGRNFDCEDFDECCNCPFGQANEKIQEALDIILNVPIKK